MSTITKLAIALIITLLALTSIIVTGCTTAPTGNIVKDTEPIKIGGLFALSGGGESWGVDEMNAALLAVDEANAEGGINGTPIKLIVEDVKTSPKSSVTATHKLIDLDNVQAIIGPTWDEQAAPMIPIAEEAGIAVISPSISGALNKDHHYAYSTWYADAPMAARLQEYAASKGQNNFAIVHQRSVWPDYITDIVIKQTETYGINLVGNYPVVGEDISDYRTTILKVKESNAKAVYVALNSDEGIYNFVKQATDANLGIPIYTSTQNLDPAFAAMYSRYTPGVYQAFPKTTERITEFTQKFEKAYGRAPTGTSAPNSYDATNLIIAALRSGARTGPEIRTWLATEKDFPGITADTITFTEDGLVVAVRGGTIIQTGKDNKFVEVTG